MPFRLRFKGITFRVDLTFVEYALGCKKVKGQAFAVQLKIINLSKRLIFFQNLKLFSKGNAMRTPNTYTSLVTFSKENLLVISGPSPLSFNINRRTKKILKNAII